jgi:hypothetical protein
MSCHYFSNDLDVENGGGLKLCYFIRGFNKQDDDNLSKDILLV